MAYGLRVGLDVRWGVTLDAGILDGGSVRRVCRSVRPLRLSILTGAEEQARDNDEHASENKCPPITEEKI